MRAARGGRLVGDHKPDGEYCTTDAVATRHRPAVAAATVTAIATTIGSTEPPFRFSRHPVATSARPRQDLVKTRLQVAASNPSAFDYEGTFDCARKIVQREGAVALFDGVLSRVLLLTPRLTIAVTCYEMAREALTSSNGNSDETSIEK